MLLRGGVGQVFLGIHSPRLDEKGRLVLPAKYREALANGVVLTMGQDRSIVLWPAAEFVSHAERVEDEVRSGSKPQSYARVLFSAASDEIPDRQGRITVPPQLRAYAGLDRDVVVVGKNTTAEIWDAQGWQTYLAAQQETFSGLDGEVRR